MLQLCIDYDIILLSNDNQYQLVSYEIYELEHNTMSNPKTTKPAGTKPAEPKKLTTAAIIKLLPEIITPSVLSKHFAINDGGKLIRRHLRKHFAANHVKNDKWTWGHDAKQLPGIINHLTKLYQFTA